MAKSSISPGKIAAFLFFGYLTFHGMRIFFIGVKPAIVNAYQLATSTDSLINWDPLIGSIIATTLLCGLGLSGIHYLLSPKSSPLPEKQILLENPSSYSNAILPTDKWLLQVFLAISVIYNGITLPLLLKLPLFFSKQQYFGSFILIWVALGGLAFMIYTYLKFKEWKRFGPAPFYMDPFPGSIGGDVGGYIDINFPYDPDIPVKVQLISRYVKRDSDGDIDDTIVWETSGIANTMHVSEGTRIQIKFNVPADLPETKPGAREDYIWQLKIGANLSGVDLSRLYQIPVYATAKKALAIEETTTETAASRNADYKAIEQISKIEQGNGVVEWLQPAGRDPHMATSQFFMGLAFTAFAMLLYFDAAPSLLTIAFALVGLSIMLAGIYVGANSLCLRLEGDTIIRWRKIFDLTLSHQEFHRQDIKGIFISRGGRMNETLYYRINIKTEDKDFIIADAIKGFQQASLTLETLSTLTGLPIIKTAS